jgi:hypothetical protein
MDFTSCRKNQLGVEESICTRPPGTFKTITDQPLVSRKDLGTKRVQAIEPLGSTAGFVGAIPVNGGRRGTGQGSVVTSDSPGVELWDAWMWTGLQRWPVATRGSVARGRACSDELSAKARVRAGWVAPLVPNQKSWVLRGEGGGGAGQKHCGGGNGDGRARRRVCERDAEPGEVYL